MNPKRANEMTGEPSKDNMTGIPDRDAVIGIIREAAAAEIMPRFRHLGKGDISENAPATW